MIKYVIDEEGSVYIVMNGSPIEIDPEPWLSEKIIDLAPGNYDEDFNRVK